MTLTNRLPWLRTRLPECALLLLGLFLRVTMRWNYKPDWGYDAGGHFQYIDWILVHRSVPPPEAFFHAFHPPLFYTLAVAFAGNDHTKAMWLPIVFGTLRLCIIWAGLEMYFHGQRWARLSALALVVVLPASVHVDGMVYGEPLSGLLLAGAMLLTLLAFRQSGRSRWWLTSLLGVVLGIALLTKISGAVILLAIGTAAGLEFVFSPHRDWRTRWQHLLPWSSTLVLCLAVCGWYFAPITRTYGRPFVTSFDILQQDALVESRAKPFLDRRSLGFLLGWDSAIYDLPYWPSSAGVRARFLSLAMVSTFVDYYNFSFSGLDPDHRTGLDANGRPLTHHLVNISRLSAMGGTFITLGAFVAFVACLYSELRRRRWGIVALLMGAGFSVLSALLFAIEYPHDGLGVIKGAYMQFGSPPLYAMFGVAVAWAQRKPSRWLLLAGFLVSLWLVASYTLYCRARFLIVPPSWII